MEIGLSLGSNLGDRLQNLKQARHFISAIPDVEIVASSPVYETDPVNVPEKYAGIPFLNAVVIVASKIDAGSMLDELVSIEKKMGRQRSTERNSPRPMDVDIIFAGNKVVKQAGLEIPHPRWAQRRFVVQPLADLRPELVIPGQDRTVRELLLTLPLTPKVVLFLQQW